MLLHIPEVLTVEELSHARMLLANAQWQDGRATAGHQALDVKHNLQLPPQGEPARELAALVQRALARNALFMSAALPKLTMTPMFNCYQGGMTYGNHVDNAIRQSRTSGAIRIRSDLSATLFLSEPEDYDGGELIIEEMYGSQAIKLPAGDLVLYPSKSLHRVTPVTRGARVSSFMWMQSLVRDDADRETLFRLDIATQRVSSERGPKDQAVIELTGVYHNLLRRWTEV